jgi:hypothetical protein
MFSTKKPPESASPSRNGAWKRRTSPVKVKDMYVSPRTPSSKTKTDYKTHISVLFVFPRKTPDKPKKPAQALSLPCTSNFVAIHVLTNRGEVQQYTAPTQNYVNEYAVQAFPDDDSGATFVGAYTRTLSEDDDSAMPDRTGRDAVLFLFQLTQGTENNEAQRRLIGESAARQLTIHAHMDLPTGFSYKYACTFEYRGDDPAYGPAYRPLAHHLQNKDAVTVYWNQFEDVDLVSLAQDPDALGDMFGDASDDTRDLTIRGGNPEVVPFNPGTP